MFKKLFADNQELFESTFPNCKVIDCLEIEFETLLEMHNGNMDKTLEGIKEYYLDCYGINLK